MLVINEKNIRDFLYHKFEKGFFEENEILKNFPHLIFAEYVYIRLSEVYENIDEKIKIYGGVIIIEIPEIEYDKYRIFSNAGISIVIDDTQYLHLYLEKFSNNVLQALHKINRTNINSSINEVIITANTDINQITIENEVEIIVAKNRFKQISCNEVPLEIKTMDGKKIVIDKLSLNGSNLEKVKQRISRVEMVEVLDQKTNIILENCNLYFIYTSYPDNDKIHLFNCEIKYKRSLFAKYASYFRDPRMINNFQSIYEILLKKDYLKKYSVELHKYVLYFNARRNAIKRFFYFLNQGYYSIIGPAIILAIMYLINNIIPYNRPIIIEFNTLTYLINPGEFFKLMSDDYNNSFLLWAGRMLNRIVFYYSLFSLFIAIKRKYGFAKKSDLQL